MTPSPQKLRVYEALHSLNRAFEQVLAVLGRLQEFPFFRREPLGHFHVVVEETRAWANFELLEVLLDREQDAWARFGRRRDRWEKKYRDPDDILLEAERLKRKLGKSAGKRGAKGSSGGRHV